MPISDSGPWRLGAPVKGREVGHNRDFVSEARVYEVDFSESRVLAMLVGLREVVELGPAGAIISNFKIGIKIANSIRISDFRSISPLRPMRDAPHLRTRAPVPFTSA